MGHWAFGDGWFTHCPVQVSCRSALIGQRRAKKFDTVALHQLLYTRIIRLDQSFVLDRQVKEELVKTSGSGHDQDMSSLVVKVLEGVRGAAGSECRSAFADGEALPVNLACELAVEHVKPLVFSGMAMQRGGRRAGVSSGARLRQSCLYQHRRVLPGMVHPAHPEVRPSDSLADPVPAFAVVIRFSSFRSISFFGFVGGNGRVLLAMKRVEQRLGRPACSRDCSGF